MRKRGDHHRYKNSRNWISYEIMKEPATSAITSKIAAADETSSSSPSSSISSPSAKNTAVVASESEIMAMARAKTSLSQTEEMSGNGNSNRSSSSGCSSASSPTITLSSQSSTNTSGSAESSAEESQSPAPSSTGGVETEMMILDGNLSEEEMMAVEEQQTATADVEVETRNVVMSLPSKEESQRNVVVAAAADEIHSKIATAFSSAFAKQNVHFEKGEMIRREGKNNHENKKER